ncbi:putative esat-6 like protein [Mycobacterium tuberculosis]|nr:putative esat-6 like protein [Mycobacterium tuberculosis]
MTINYQFGDVDAHGAMIRAQAGLLEAGFRGVTTGDQLREDVRRPGFGLAGGRGSDVGQRGE